MVESSTYLNLVYIEDSNSVVAQATKYVCTTLSKARPTTSLRTHLVGIARVAACALDYDARYQNAVLVFQRRRPWS